MQTTIQTKDRFFGVKPSQTFTSFKACNFTNRIPNEVIKNVYFAGAVEKDKKLFTNSGRVLGVTGVDSSLKKAIEKSYSMVNKIEFKNAYYRHDIGKKALEKEMEEK